MKNHGNEGGIGQHRQRLMTYIQTINKHEGHR